MDDFDDSGFVTLISNTGFAIEIVGVIVIVLGFIVATFSLLRRWSSLSSTDRFLAYRRGLAQTMMLGLEFLVAGDIIRTVFVADSLEDVRCL